MKKTFRVILSTLLITACTFAFFSCNKAPVAWETDFSTAAQYAEEQKKDLLIFFSGNEWDGLSPDLMANFLSNKKFMKEAGKEFILFTVDVPSDVSGMTDEAYTQLMLLTGTCGISTCPAIIACDLEGVPYYEIAYQDGVTTLDDLINDVKSAAAVKKTIATLEAKLETAQGAERVRIIDELVSSIPELYVGRYYELMSTIPTIDPTNESGLVGKYLLVAAEQEATMLMYSGDYAGAIDEFAKTAENDFLTTSQKQECLYYASYFSMQLEMLPEMLDYMERAYNLDPTSETGILIGEMLPQMKEQVLLLQQQELTEEQ
ncbi:MAG: thioredoxin family protein [Treponema sp.]|nr:thioredoxin family protein [Candidatus Treponema caballi]